MNIINNFFTFFRSRNNKFYCFNYRYRENKIFSNSIRNHSRFNWRLIHSVNFEDYIWWSYPNFQRNDKFEIFCDNLDLRTNNGLPKCIIKIVETINIGTYFNKNIRRFAWVLTWCQRVFWYYHRFYRYLNNERLFGKKKFLNYSHGHKLHLISYLKKRELTGIRLNKNHLHFN